MKKIFLLTLAAIACCATAFSQEVIKTEDMPKKITSFSLGDNCKRIIFSFPTTTPTGKDTVMHGAILMNSEVYTNKSAPKGIILNHQYTITASNQCATRAESLNIESMLLTENGLWGVIKGVNNNYIIVSPNNYGFGGDKIDRQAYLYGDITAKGALDCLRAAKTVLDNEGFTYGSILASVGYSQGGHSSMSTLKFSETNASYNDIKFDGVFCGAGPYDIDVFYKQLVKDGAVTRYPVSLPLTFSNITSMEQLMGNEVFTKYSNKDLFSEKITDKVPEWLNGSYGSDSINTLIYSIYNTSDSVKVAEMLTHNVMDSTTTISNDYRAIMRKNSLVYSDWTPNASDNIYMYHNTGDDVVPVECTISMDNYLKNSGFNGKLDVKYDNTDLSAFKSFVNAGTHLMGAIFFVNYASEILNNLEPTSIQELNVQETKNVDNNIYDLLGRKLNGIPESGIYIKNGKKYIK